MTLEPESDYGPAPRRRGLRTGFTTGACAAAATRAACLALREESPTVIDIALPAGFTASFAVHSLTTDGPCARASVVKDAGDDPDVTHGAEIGAQVELGRRPPPGLSRQWAVVAPGSVARQLHRGSVIERAHAVAQVAKKKRAELVETESDAKVKTVKARLRFSYDEPTGIEWVQEKGDTKSLRGWWTFEDLGGGRTRATYGLDVDPGRMLGLLLRGPVESQPDSRVAMTSPISSGPSAGGANATGASAVVEGAWVKGAM